MPRPWWVGDNSTSRRKISSSPKVDVEPADVHTIDADNLYPFRLEIPGVNSALIVLVPTPDLGYVLIEGAPMQTEAELDVGAAGRDHGQSSSVEHTCLSPPCLILMADPPPVRHQP